TKPDTTVSTTPDPKHGAGAPDGGDGRSSRTASARLTNPRALAQQGFLSVWIRSFLILLILCAAWCLATPLGGAPDEPAQVVKEAATVRGQLIGQPAPHLPAA